MQEYEVSGYAIKTHKILSTEFVWQVTPEQFMERVKSEMQHLGSKLLIEKVTPVATGNRVLEYGPGSPEPQPNEDLDPGLESEWMT